MAEISNRRNMNDNLQIQNFTKKDRQILVDIISLNRIVFSFRDRQILVDIISLNRIVFSFRDRQILVDIISLNRIVFSFCSKQDFVEVNTPSVLCVFCACSATFA